MKMKEMGHDFPQKLRREVQGELQIVRKGRERVEQKDVVWNGMIGIKCTA